MKQSGSTEPVSVLTSLDTMALDILKLYVELSCLSMKMVYWLALPQGAR